MEVIDPIPIELDSEEFLLTLRIRRPVDKKIAQIIEKCRRLIEPKTIYTFVKVMDIKNDEVRLESGITLKSIILADMLECGQTIVPYVATIGLKLENQIQENAKGSIIRAWVMEKLGDYAVGKSVAFIKSRVGETLGRVVSRFSPGTGTGELFNIEQQEILFRILDPPTSIGVCLMPSYMMVPRKSSSGVFAATHQEYVACQHCPKKCENRKKQFIGDYIRAKRENQARASKPNHGIRLPIGTDFSHGRTP